MHALRASSSLIRLVRLVLAWFALTLGVAIAAPLVQPQVLELVCGDGGIKLVVVGDDGQARAAGPHTLECPACLPASLSPPPALSQADRLPEVGGVPPLRHAAVRVALAGAALPARGPPAQA